MRRSGDTISFLPLLSMVVLFLRRGGYQKAFDNLLEVRWVNSMRFLSFSILHLSKFCAIVLLWWPCIICISTTSLISVSLGLASSLYQLPTVKECEFDIVVWYILPFDQYFMNFFEILRKRPLKEQRKRYHISVLEVGFLGRTNLRLGFED